LLILFICSVAKETHTRLLRSLVIILLVSIGGYLTSLIFYQLLLNVNLGLQPIRIWQLSFIGAIVLNISAAANGPILYINRQVQLQKGFMFLFFYHRLLKTKLNWHSKKSNLARKKICFLVIFI
jgi:hypothetical protein